MATPVQLALDRFRVAVFLPTRKRGSEAQTTAIEKHSASLSAKKARLLFEGLNPSSGPWNAVATAFTFEKYFAAEVREAALHTLADKAGIARVVVRLPSGTGPRATGKGRPVKSSRAVQPRSGRKASAGRSTRKRGLKARERACKKFYPQATMPGWHFTLRKALEKSEDVLATFRRIVPEGGEKRLYARLCGSNDPFHGWFKNPANIAKADRKAALQWLATKAGLVPRRRRRLVRLTKMRATSRKLIRLRPKTLAELKAPITEAEIIRGVNLRRLKSLRDRLVHDSTLSLWYLAVFHLGDPGLIPDVTSTGGSMNLPAPKSVVALIGQNQTHDWMTHQAFDRTAKKFGRSEAYFKRLIASYESEFEAVSLKILGNLFGRRLAELAKLRQLFGDNSHVRSFANQAPSSGMTRTNANGAPMQAVFKDVTSLDLKVLSSLYRFVVEPDFLKPNLNNVLNEHNANRQQDLQQYVLSDISAREATIRDAWKKLKEPRRIYDLKEEFRNRFIALLRINEDTNTLAATIVKHARGPADLTNAALMVASLALALVPGGLLVRLALVGIAAWDASREYEAHAFEKGLHKLNLLSEHRSFFWMILAVADVGFEAGGGIKAAYGFLKRAPAKALKAGDTLAVAKALEPHAPNQQTRDALAQVIRSERAVEAAANASAAARKKLTSISSLAMGVGIPPIPTGLSRKNLVKLAVLEINRGKLSVELLWKRMRANAAFTKLSAKQQKALVDSLSSQARGIVRLSSKWSTRALPTLRAAIQKRKSLNLDVIKSGLGKNWDEIFDFGNKTLPSYRKGGRSRLGGLNRIKGHLQEIFYRGLPFHKVREKAAAKIVEDLQKLGKGKWSPPEFVTDVFQGTGGLTDGMWISRSSKGKVAILDIYEAKSKNWAALKKQAPKDVRRLKQSVRISGKTFGPNDIHFVPELVPTRPQRWIHLLPTQLKKGTDIQRKVVARSEAALAGTLASKVQPGNSPLTNEAAKELAELLVQILEKTK